MSRATRTEQMNTSQKINIELQEPIKRKLHRIKIKSYSNQTKEQYTETKKNEIYKIHSKRVCVVIAIDKIELRRRTT